MKKGAAVIYTETTKQAAEVARFALNEMSKGGIPPNPQNFLVWYEYYSGRNAPLRKAIDSLRSKGQRMTVDHTVALYERFFAEHAAGVDIEGWGARIQATATQIIEALTAAGSNTANYGAALQNFSGTLADATSTGDIRALVEGILDATRAMNGHVHRLQSRLEGSAQEIVELRQKLEASRMEALTDSLTGIANRKCFEERLELEARRAEESGEPLCLVMTDIDHFKTLNDRFGHPFGDQVLKLVARTLFEGIKGRDTAARYGGEEFALILPSTPLHGAVVVAENMRKAIAAKKLARKGASETLGAITLSFGATEHIMGEPLADFVRRADELLYRAKRLGRNRVIAEAGPDIVARDVSALA